MSDNTSVIDAVRRIAKATKEDPDGTSDIVKGALHPEQIDDVRIMLSRARTGSLQGAATSSSPPLLRRLAPPSAILLCRGGNGGPLRTRPPLNTRRTFLR